MSDDLVGTGTIDSTPKVDNKMMASFRIDRDDWKRFGELGKRERLTVTELITDYVEKCLAADRSWYGVEISTDKDDVSIGHSNIISTGKDEVLKQVEKMISTHKDEILTLVEKKISMAIGTLSLPYGSDTTNASSSPNPEVESVRLGSPPMQQTQVDEPEWVNSDNRRFYLKLVNDPVLVGKVAEAIAQYPKDNKALASSLVEMGLHKNDGTALDSASTSRVKAVVGHLPQ